MKSEVRLLRQDEICGPVNEVMGNYILFLLMEKTKHPDCQAFADLLLKRLEGAEPSAERKEA